MLHSNSGKPSVSSSHSSLSSISSYCSLFRNLRSGKPLADCTRACEGSCFSSINQEDINFFTLLHKRMSANRQGKFTACKSTTVTTTGTVERGGESQTQQCLQRCWCRLPFHSVSCTRCVTAMKRSIKPFAP